MSGRASTIASPRSTSRPLNAMRATSPSDQRVTTSPASALHRVSMGPVLAGHSSFSSRTVTPGAAMTCTGASTSTASRAVAIRATMTTSVRCGRGPRHLGGTRAGCAAEARRQRPEQPRLLSYSTQSPRHPSQYRCGTRGSFPGGRRCFTPDARASEGDGRQSPPASSRSPPPACASGGPPTAPPVVVSTRQALPRRRVQSWLVAAASVARSEHTMM